ncbi:conserved hypothetical protein [Talaromyces stipitatus ATCC 10500]|uniref:Mitochondrial large ribosomal subunit n=1 Tax=Talaromyces stipitatus (strain ATCC 10500 / CBS 375.48 / QM 6759 / NRRL 1006) TaxID=441959 RepID=B8MKH1_TALSN|nr:uncharacterized protein TSTA_047720 [Talaromyces stipitatus ATCC 10500]EED15326.1 conserved hypothetical protein [Talaromyces stipitatus ATCC 10500]
MASRGAGLPFRQLIQSSRSTTLAYRRAISYTHPLRAEVEQDKNEKDSKDKKKPSLFESMKGFMFSRAPQPGDKPARKPQPPPQIQRTGSLSQDSIFADEAAGEIEEEESTKPKGSAKLEDRLWGNMLRVVDPKPEARKRWERKMIIREVRKRGRLTKQEIIMATERESLVKSHWFKTSVKKLTPLARQIAGKNIDEAILQMRFSKKKAAKDVLEHLQLAKNTAIVRHGMGLTKAGESGRKMVPITVILKDGERHTITDPTSIYIAQAWVNRGPFGSDWDHRARGKINLLRLPYTGLSVLLKEEKTRIREWNDRETRALRQRKSQLWVQLPDRPVSQQNQYYSW